MLAQESHTVERQKQWWGEVHNAYDEPKDIYTFVPFHFLQRSLSIIRRFPIFYDVAVHDKKLKC